MQSKYETIYRAASHLPESLYGPLGVALGKITPLDAKHRVVASSDHARSQGWIAFGDLTAATTCDQEGVRSADKDPDSPVSPELLEVALQGFAHERWGRNHAGEYSEQASL